MSQLKVLRSLLNGVDVSDDMIGRGVRLTQDGTKKVAAKLNVSETDVERLLGELAAQLRGEELPQHIAEGKKRFTYESDFLGNVTLRDRKTGDTRHLMGQEAFQLLAEIERVGGAQRIIAPYFIHSLRESEADTDLVDVDSEMGNQSGTYNFPFRGYFATAKFWVEGGEFKVKVISIRDQDGEEVTVDSSTRQQADKTAIEWVDKV